MFSKLKVQEIKKETSDSVSIAFEIPVELKSDFEYKSGQYITVRKEVAGEDVRRAYSLCSAPSENDYRIGVKKVINISLLVLIFSTLIAYIAPETGYPKQLFWIAAILIGLMVGPNQSCSRSLMSKLIPSNKKNEFFGFFSFTGKHLPKFDVFEENYFPYML